MARIQLPLSAAAAAASSCSIRPSGLYEVEVIMRGEGRGRGEVDRYVDRCMDRQMYGQTDRWIDG